MGSSPLARGLLWGLRRRPHRGPDHPRSRGVYLRLEAKLDGESGSSPLARGLLLSDADFRHEYGIIPARAGFTPTSRCAPCPSGDHPRSRGVYTRRWRRRTRSPGSSPLARGLLIAAGLRDCDRRIIPARAGFTRSTHSTRGSREDHPRSRGVYRTLDAVESPEMGSSPLARGLRLGRDVDQRPLGIIPARAGFTRAVERPPCPGPDHPRSRGVYVRFAISALVSAGSSPLARGLLIGSRIVTTR